MAFSETARVVALGALWKTMGSRTVGRALVSLLGADDENARTLAGMFLVQSGKRAEGVLFEALADRTNLPTVLTILGDIGDDDSEKTLGGLVNDGDPNVARAAREALRVIDRKRSMTAV